MIIKVSYFVVTFTERSVNLVREMFDLKLTMEYNFEFMCIDQINVHIILDLYFLISKKGNKKIPFQWKWHQFHFVFFFYSYCLKNSTAASEFPWNLAKYAGFCSYILRNMYIIAIFMKFLMLSTAVMGRANKLKTRTEFINTSKFISSLYFFMF